MKRAKMHTNRKSLISLVKEISDNA